MTQKTPKTPLTPLTKADAETKELINFLLGYQEQEPVQEHEAPHSFLSELSDEDILLLFCRSMEHGNDEKSVERIDEAALRLANAFSGNKVKSVTAPIVIIAKAFLLGLEQGLFICEMS